MNPGRWDGLYLRLGGVQFGIDFWKNTGEYYATERDRPVRITLQRHRLLPRSRRVIRDLRHESQRE